MVETENRQHTDPHASESAGYVGWLVKLEILRSRSQQEERATEVVDASGLGDIGDVLRIIEADFQQITLPLLGKSERLLPCHAYFRLRKVGLRWERWLYEKTGDTSQYRVRVDVGPAAPHEAPSPELEADLIEKESKSTRQIEVRVLSVGSEPISSRTLLGRFHPDHKEPNIFDAIEYAQR